MLLAEPGSLQVACGVSGPHLCGRRTSVPEPMFGINPTLSDRISSCSPSGYSGRLVLPGALAGFPGVCDLRAGKHQRHRKVLRL